jgi:hypothetical protein
MFDNKETRLLLLERDSQQNNRQFDNKTFCITKLAGWICKEVCYTILNFN